MNSVVISVTKLCDEWFVPMFVATEVTYDTLIRAGYTKALLAGTEMTVSGVAQGDIESRYINGASNIYEGFSRSQGKNLVAPSTSCVTPSTAIGPPLP